MNKFIAGTFFAILTLPMDVQALIPLKDGTPEEVVSAIDGAVMQKAKDKATVAALIQALETPETDIRVKERAAWALGQFRAESATKSLLNAASHKSLLIRSAALNSLIQLRAKTALPIFIETAQNDLILNLRERSTVALGLLKSDKAIDALVKLSSDVREEIRGAAALSMSALHSTKSDFSEILQDMGKDPSPYVQERAKIALDLANGKPAIVYPLLSSPDSDIRMFAAQYFISKGKPADLKTLQPAQNAEANEDVRDILKDAVTAIQKRAAQQKAAQKKAAQKKKAALPK